ncbi:oxidoreductase [Streptantibioticus silvisoli]|uniref:12-oxophytodienoate reductase n=1 Tax=Streptantibioticus silvisoli TaxID=2705255 RepID=A0ABT6W7B9_9ACTN|nr:12-oxophytodienoate reductase [Streptantibioticus silvisoli]MDI5966549.1 12-oxophytodienoate reductase [Streptantibioticus silvisoli]
MSAYSAAEAAGTAEALAPLLTPFSAAGLSLRNRFAMAPMTMQRSPDGVPGPWSVDHYRAVAAGGTGLLITEGTVVRDPASSVSSRIPRFHGEQSGAGWRTVVEAVHAEGAAIIPQLWHNGVLRGASPDSHPDVPSKSPSGVDLDGAPLGEELTTAGIDSIIADFAESAALAKQWGFDGLELHGAHGYLLDEFVWSGTNRRTDRYGSAARMTFPVEVVKAVRAAVGPGFPVVYRFSQWKPGHYDARIVRTPAELEGFLRPLHEAGVDVFHPSTRRHWQPEFTGEDARLGLAGWVKKLTGAPVIAVGSVGVDTEFRSDGAPLADSRAHRLRLLAEQFDRGDFDVIALGRALLGDPAWVAKATGGRAQEIVDYTG